MASPTYTAPPRVDEEQHNDWADRLHDDVYGLDPNSPGKLNRDNVPDLGALQDQVAALIAALQAQGISTG